LLEDPRFLLKHPRILLDDSQLSWPSRLRNKNNNNNNNINTRDINNSTWHTFPHHALVLRARMCLLLFVSYLSCRSNTTSGQTRDSRDRRPLPQPHPPAEVVVDGHSAGPAKHRAKVFHYEFSIIVINAHRQTRTHAQTNSLTHAHNRGLLKEKHGHDRAISYGQI
jgi:hypothetical protein